MPEPKDLERPASPLADLPPRGDLLASEKEDLVDRLESMARELQRRLDAEEEILHLNFQKGTASLQAQVEEVSRRYRTAQQELDAFRAEILASEEADRATPRAFVFENLEAPATPEGSDPRQLRAVLAVFRRLRAERDRLRADIERTRREAEQARRELDGARAGATRAADEEAGRQRAVLEEDNQRLQQALSEAQSECASLRIEQSRIQESLGLEQERGRTLDAETSRLREQTAQLEKRVEEALQPPPPPPPPPTPVDGHALLQDFLQKIRLKELLEKNIPGPARPGQPAPWEFLSETIEAVIAAQDRPLEAIKDLPFEIARPPKKPELLELRQFVEELPDSAASGLLRVHDALRSAQSSMPKKLEILTVDLDSLELVIGPKPRPNQVYWPLVCFVPELREFWRGDFRTTPRFGPKESLSFLSEALSKAPTSIEKSRLRFRMDARFFSEPVLRLLESKKCTYVLVAPDSPELRAEARLCRFFSELPGGWEVGEVQQGVAAVRGTQARCVVLRHLYPAQGLGRMPFLFRDPQFAYSVFVIDKGTTPLQALESFTARREAEELEHALLRDFCVNRLLGRGAKSHANCFQIYLLASNLLQWFRRKVKVAPEQVGPT